MPPAQTDAPNPLSRVSRVEASDHRHSEVGDGKDDATSPFIDETGAEEGFAFNEKVGPGRGTAKLSYLLPKSAFEHRAMKVVCCLPLDEAGAARRIVTGKQLAFDDVNAKPAELVRNAPAALMDIGIDLHAFRACRTGYRDTATHLARIGNN